MMGEQRCELYRKGHTTRHSLFHLRHLLGIHPSVQLERNEKVYLSNQLKVAYLQDEKFMYIFASEPSM